MIKKMLVLSFAILLSGCDTGPTAPSMSSIMASCDTPKISDFNSCIQSNYTRDLGNRNVQSLYARLDSIVADQQSEKINQTKAKAMAYTAYDETVGAGNKAVTAN